MKRELKEVRDETASHERLVIVTGVRRLPAVLLAVGSLAIGALFAWNAVHAHARPGHPASLLYGVLAGATTALGLFWFWEGLTSPDRVVALHRGRIEVMEGRSVQRWPASGFKWVELQRRVFSTTRYQSHSVDLGIVTPEGRQWLTGDGASHWYASDEWLFQSIQRALEALELREKLAPSPGSWHLPSRPGEWSGFLLLGGAMLAVAAVPGYFGSLLAKLRRRASAPIAPPNGIFLERDRLVLAGDGRFSTIPRGRVLSIARNSEQALMVEYCSEAGHREWLHLAGRFPVMSGDPTLDVLQRWFRG